MTSKQIQNVDVALYQYRNEPTLASAQQLSQAWRALDASELFTAYGLLAHAIMQTFDENGLSVAWYQPFSAIQHTQIASQAATCCLELEWVVTLKLQANLLNENINQPRYNAICNQIAHTQRTAFYTLPHNSQLLLIGAWKQFLNNHPTVLDSLKHCIETHFEPPKNWISQNPLLMILSTHPAMAMKPENKKKNEHSTPTPHEIQDPIEYAPNPPVQATREPTGTAAIRMQMAVKWHAVGNSAGPRELQHQTGFRHIVLSASDTIQRAVDHLLHVTEPFYNIDTRGTTYASPQCDFIEINVTGLSEDEATILYKEIKADLTSQLGSRIQEYEFYVGDYTGWLNPSQFQTTFTYTK